MKVMQKKESKVVNNLMKEKFLDFFTPEKDPKILTYRRSGRRLILISIALAMISMSMHWARVFIFYKTGIELQLTFVFVFWLYPAITSLFLFPINRWIIRGITRLHILISLGLIYHISNKTVFFGLISVSVSFGAWLYLLSVILLWYGSYRYTYNANSRDN